ncbi:hypothetical protein B5F39_03375 [Cloacibacillus sp. An23]|nr:hypothetical protein B5F39_03375 [Cloacibacillus sp. An23]
MQRRIRLRTAKRAAFLLQPYGPRRRLTWQIAPGGCAFYAGKKRERLRLSRPFCVVFRFARI